jgi:thioredoxin reductase (NADPH)
LPKGGYIKVASGTTRSNAEGVYAAGGCAKFVYRQVVVVERTGCMAALEPGNFSAKHSPDPEVRIDEPEQRDMIGLGLPPRGQG